MGTYVQELEFQQNAWSAEKLYAAPIPELETTSPSPEEAKKHTDKGNYGLSEPRVTNHFLYGAYYRALESSKFKNQWIEILRDNVANGPPMVNEVVSLTKVGSDLYKKGDLLVVNRNLNNHGKYGIRPFKWKPCGPRIIPSH